MHVRAHGKNICFEAPERGRLLAIGKRKRFNGDPELYRVAIEMNSHGCDYGCNFCSNGRDSSVSSTKKKEMPVSGNKEFPSVDGKGREKGHIGNGYA